MIVMSAAGESSGGLHASGVLAGEGGSGACTAPVPVIQTRGSERGACPTQTGPSMPRTQAAAAATKVS